MTPRRLLTALPAIAGVAAAAAIGGLGVLAVGLALVFAAGVLALLDTLFRKDRS